jgi:hypothetical protein
MQRRRRSANRQQELFPRSIRPTIAIEENHRLVQMTDRLDWTELEEVAQSIRRSKLKSAAGRPPHLRALIGAVLFRATRRRPYRDTEDQIRHYGPARYLCGLTETDWTPDANTIQDFEELLGEDGARRLNEYIVEEAVSAGLADPKMLVADITAQEAAIPHPNEMGLMATFMTAISAASQRVGGSLKRWAKSAATLFGAAKRTLRESRLFSKDKTKEAKDKMTAAMAKIIESVQRQLGRALEAAASQSHKLPQYKKVAWAKLLSLHDTMSRLLPQVRYWLKYGRVAAGKIISLHIPELYSVVRGKVGKAVEFGLKWGISRLGGGYLRATWAKQRGDFEDTHFAVGAVQNHIELFGEAPISYAYDRAGHSQQNIRVLKSLGVRDVGLAPRGRAKSPVSGKVKDQLVRERAQVEGGIGAIKGQRYGFNCPPVRSVGSMAASGQRSVLGFNLNKLIRELGRRDELGLVG